MTDEKIRVDKSESRDDSKKQIREKAGTNNKFVIKTTDELNKCVDHIYNLLNSGFILYDRGIYSSSNFFSIAAIEEIVKVYNALFSKDVDGYSGNGMGKKIFGPDYYLWMDDRLTDAVEEADLKETFDSYNSGSLVNLKNNSVYCQRRSDVMSLPADIVDQKCARNMLLFAIQAYEDNIAGYSLYAINISKKTDKLFEAIIGQE